MLQQQYTSIAKRVGKVSTAASLTLLGLMAHVPAWAAGALDGEVKKQPVNISAIIMFLMFVVATLGITFGHQNKIKPPRISIQRVAVSLVPKTVLRLPVTICRQLLS